MLQPISQISFDEYNWLIDKNSIIQSYNIFSQSNGFEFISNRFVDEKMFQRQKKKRIECSLELLFIISSLILPLSLSLFTVSSSFLFSFFSFINRKCSLHIYLSIFHFLTHHSWPSSRSYFLISLLYLLLGNDWVFRSAIFANHQMIIFLRGIFSKIPYKFAFFSLWLIDGLIAYKDIETMVRSIAFIIQFFSRFIPLDKFAKFCSQKESNAE